MSKEIRGAVGKANNERDLIEDEIYTDEGREVLPIKYSITSYGADYTIDSIVRRMKEADILVPRFQRAYVWPLSKASRFVESLLLGLPVPGVFLSLEEKTNRLLVIDGQQRLKTLLYFYDGVFEPTGKKFALTGIESKFEGHTYRDLPTKDRRRLDDSILHATITRQDEPSEDDSSIYHIFERLNTGGVTLQPQEIRACIYHGPFNDLLHHLNQNRDWRSIFGSVNRRMRDQELILRFLAFYRDAKKYHPPLTEFLNGFMGRNRELPEERQKEFERAFQSAIAVIHQAVGTRAFRPTRAINAAVFDAVMVGVARRLRDGEITNVKKLRERYDSLVEDRAFIEATSTGTTQEANVLKRLTQAEKQFADVK